MSTRLSFVCNGHERRRQNVSTVNNNRVYVRFHSLPLVPHHPHLDNDVDKIITSPASYTGALDVYDITIECKINIRLKGRKKL